MRTEQHRKHLSEALKGKHLSPSTEFKKGHAPWNKGKSGVQKAWNKGLKLGKGFCNRERHKKLVLEEARNWERQGFRYIPLTQAIPDAIAIDFQSRKVYAIEIELQAKTQKLRKYNEIVFFDDVYWIRVEK